MSGKELIKNRYFIVLEGLLKGIQLDYKNDWRIFYSNGQVYQTYFNKSIKEQVVHKSDITLQAFLKRFDQMSLEEIKRIFADIKLFSLQEKLMKGES